MEDEFRRRLNEFSTGEIKKIIRLHNLHYFMKLGQKKAGLIDSIVNHLKLNGDTVSSKKPVSIDLKDFSPTKDVMSVRKYKKDEADKKEAEDKKEREKKEAEDNKKGADKKTLSTPRQLAQKRYRDKQKAKA